MGTSNPMSGIDPLRYYRGVSNLLSSGNGITPAERAALLKARSNFHTKVFSAGGLGAVGSGFLAKWGIDKYEKRKASTAYIGMAGPKKLSVLKKSLIIGGTSLLGGYLSTNIAAIPAIRAFMNNTASTVLQILVRMT